MSLQDTPIRQKLMVILMLASGTVLLMTCTAFFAYDFLTFRQQTIRELSTLSQMIAANSVEELSSGNFNRGREILLALQAEAHVVAAGLYDRQGKLVAKHPQELPDSDLPAVPEQDGYRFRHADLAMFQPVVEVGGQRLGTLYLKSNAGGLYARFAHYGGIVILVMAFSFLAAYTLSRRLQRQISQPILALAETAKGVSDRQDYSVRATRLGRDEIGLLTDSFNQMLVQIQERERALNQANELLRAEIAERKRTEEALDQNRSQLQTIVENVAEGVAVSALDGQLLHFNRAALDMHGFASLAECLRRLPEFAETFELSDLDGTKWTIEQWPLARILRGENLRDLEVRIRRIGADWERIFNYGGTLVRDASGQPLMAVVTIRDITERKLADQRLRSQLERLNLLHQITRAIGERQDMRSIFQTVVRSLEDQLPIDFGCFGLYDPVAHELTFTNVGVRSHALAQQLASPEQARVAIDQNGLNRCVQGHLVYEPDISQVRTPFPSRLAQAGLASVVMAPLLVESKVLGVLVAGRRQAQSFSSGECEFLRQLSEHVALAAHQAQLYGELQQAYEDLRQTQQAVMQQERLRALGQMASGIAHDINNAISPVSLYTESLLEKEPNLSQRARDYLTTIQHAIGDVAETVSRMREFYRQREPQLTLTPVHLNRLVQQVVDLTRARWSDMPQQRGVVIELKTQLAPELSVIMGVESEIREALTNLIFNAVDAMPEGGTLTVRTGATSDLPVAASRESAADLTSLAESKKSAELSRDTATDSQASAGYVHVEVCDSGMGMNDETKRRCLEPFFTTKGERGTGLGLAMVYGVVRRHSADIEIESAMGQGTTVRLIFAAATPVADSPRTTRPHLVTSRLRILVVDDDPLLIKSLRDTLEGDGHQVVAANGGQAGIDAFRASRQLKEPFAIVITDLGMPYVDGRKVASEIKAMSASVPVILLTGWGRRLVAEGDVPSHVDRVLNKPPKLQELRTALAELTANPSTT